MRTGVLTEFYYGEHMMKSAKELGVPLVLLDIDTEAVKRAEI